MPPQVCAFRVSKKNSLFPYNTNRRQIWHSNNRRVQISLQKPSSFALHFEPSNPPFISKRCPSFSSAALSHPLSHFLSPSSPPLHCQTENVRWANAIHSLTNGKLGLLLQGSDRLVPEACFSFSLNPLTHWSPLHCFSLIYSHKVTLCLREALLAVEVIKKKLFSLSL